MIAVHTCWLVAGLTLLIAGTATDRSTRLASPPPSAPGPEIVVPNDNRRPAGKRDAGTLTLRLRAGQGRWQPEGPDGPAVSIEALGEVAAPLTAPAPFIRADEGTLIVASVRNDLDAPLVVVRFTPPRAGTFMYHTHLHDERQLPLGLYGPMIVLDSGETFDPETDHVLIIGRSGLDPASPNVLVPVTPVVLNGETAPRFVWRPGTRHRVRLINITPGDIFTVSLQTAQGPVTWTPVTKDGAPLPFSARTPQPARQTIAVGETYDFEVDVAPGRRSLWIEVRSPAGKWQAQAQVIVR